MRERLLPTIAFLAALVLAACQRTAAPAAAPAAAAPAASSPAPAPAAAPALRSSTVPPPMSAGSSPAAIVLSRTQEPRAGSQARSLANASALLALGRTQGGILPEDFRIGPLGNGRAGKPEGDAAFATASGFLSRLVAGTIDRQSMTPDAQENLSDTLSYGLQQGYAPGSFRLGVPKEETNGEVAVNVRLFDSDSSSEGEIYLARAADHWLVADVQVNLADLAVPRASPKDRFFPSPYRWLLVE